MQSTIVNPEGSLVDNLLLQLKEQCEGFDDKFKDLIQEQLLPPRDRDRIRAVPQSPKAKKAIRSRERFPGSDCSSSSSNGSEER